MGTPKKDANIPDSIDEQLKMIPVKNERVSILPTSTDSLLVLEVPLKRRGVAKLLSGVLNLSKTKQLSLEGYALQVFKKFNNETNLADLIKQLQTEHALTFYEGRSLILQYVKMLMEKGLIVLVKQ